MSLLHAQCGNLHVTQDRRTARGHCRESPERLRRCALSPLQPGPERAPSAFCLEHRQHVPLNHPHPAAPAFRADRASMDLPQDVPGLEPVVVREELQDDHASRAVVADRFRWWQPVASASGALPRHPPHRGAPHPRAPKELNAGVSRVKPPSDDVRWLRFDRDPFVSGEPVEGAVLLHDPSFHTESASHDVVGVHSCPGADESLPGVGR